MSVCGMDLVKIQKKKLLNTLAQCIPRLYQTDGGIAQLQNGTRYQNHQKIMTTKMKLQIIKENSGQL